MKDRFTSGAISGIIAGVIASLVNIISVNMFNFGHLRYADFSGIFIYGRKPANLIEFLFAFVGYLIFSGGLGVIFAYMLRLITPKYFWFKSICFGFGVWFFTYAVTLLFQIPELLRISFESALINFVASGVFGLSLGVAFLWLEGRAEVLEEE